MSDEIEDLESRIVEDLTRAAPLPPPTTVSTRSLRPRRSKGRSSRASTVSSARSRSSSVIEASQLAERGGVDAGPFRSGTHERATGSGNPETGVGSDLGGENKDIAGRRRQKRVRSSASQAGRHPAKRAKVEQSQNSTTSASTSTELDPSPPVFPVSSAETAEGEASTRVRTAMGSPRDHSLLFPEEDPRDVFNRLMDQSIPDFAGTPAAAERSTFAGSSTALDAGAAPPELSNLSEGGTTAPSSAPVEPTIPTDPNTTPPVREPHEASSSQGHSVAAPAARAPEDVHMHEVEPLASYTCPVCFSPPTYATITPCGHVLCGDCLFTAVKTTIQRGAYTLPVGERMVARCPVCRAAIPGWDGRGGGVIGLRPRAVFSL